MFFGMSRDAAWWGGTCVSNYTSGVQKIPWRHVAWAI
jgi:hypothetical protein